MLQVLTASYQTADFQQHYTDAEEINTLMQSLLGAVDGLKVLEPCVGLGAFVLGLIGTPERVDAVDIDENHIEFLDSKGISWLHAFHGDFIDYQAAGDLFKTFRLRTDYDALICNPPYGLKLSIPYRQNFKKRFPHLYARESYGLFMYFAIRALRESGRYVFIVPDTFLTSRNHKPLREFLVREAKPTHIIRFESKRFETVNFGYGHLCIIAGNHSTLRPDDLVRWVDAIEQGARLTAELFAKEQPVPGSFFHKHTVDGWVHPAKREAISLSCLSTYLGAIAECRTGIYTGDNVRFCAFDSHRPPSRAANGHPIDWTTKVKLDCLSEEEKKLGIEGDRCYVPFIRGGHRAPLAHTSWALDWSKEAVAYYAKDNKARLQNSRYYFKPGLAIPMVTSGRISASLIKDAVFDQGVVGVFPNDPNWLDFLLIYINSDFVARTVKAVLSPGANNSANYIKKIPVPVPSAAQLAKAKRIVGQARSTSWEQTAGDRENLLSQLGVCRATTSSSSSSPKDGTLNPSSTEVTGLLESQ